MVLNMRKNILYNLYRSWRRCCLIHCIYIYICNIYVYMSIIFFISSTVRILQDLKFKVPHNIQVS